MLFISEIRDRLTTIAVSADEYVDALESTTTRGVSGGAIYDALLARCAVKAHAETIYTWNLRHYALCGQDVARRLRTP